MNKISFRKAIIEAYMAGFAAAIDLDANEYLTKEEAKDWFYNEYGLQDSEEKCDCCEEE